MSKASKLFPAHAGVIPLFPPPKVAFFAFPRTRGGDPCGSSCTISVRAFSPHTRG